jgi:hypothetical protein
MSQFRTADENTECLTLLNTHMGRHILVGRLSGIWTQSGIVTDSKCATAYRHFGEAAIPEGNAGRAPSLHQFIPRHSPYNRGKITNIRNCDTQPYINIAHWGSRSIRKENLRKNGDWIAGWLKGNRTLLERSGINRQYKTDGIEEREE